MSKWLFYNAKASWVSAPYWYGSKARPQTGRLWRQQPLIPWASRPEPFRSGDTGEAKKLSTANQKTLCPPPVGRYRWFALFEASNPALKDKCWKSSHGDQQHASRAKSLHEGPEKHAKKGKCTNQLCSVLNCCGGWALLSCTVTIEPLDGAISTEKKEGMESSTACESLENRNMQTVTGSARK